MKRTAWTAAQTNGVYAPPELTHDGFLHCCTPAQLSFVMARHFVGVSELLVITFETDHVPSPLRWVDSEPDQEPFPHLYGPIPVAAVLRAEVM